MEDIAVANFAVHDYNPPRLPGFQIRNLSALEFARGFTFWHYHAVADTPEMLAAPGYFDAAQDMFQPGVFNDPTANNPTKLSSRSATAKIVPASLLGTSPLALLGSQCS